MIRSKRGTSIAINMVIFLAVAALVAIVAFYIYSEGWSLAGKTKETSGTIKDSLVKLDFDNLKANTDTIKKFCSKNPRECVGDLIANAESKIPSNCEQAKNIAEILLSGNVEGAKIEITDNERDNIIELKQKAEICIKEAQQEADAKKEIIDNLKDDEKTTMDNLLKYYGEIIDAYVVKDCKSLSSSFEKMKSGPVNFFRSSTDEGVLSIVNNINGQSNYFNFACPVVTSKDVGGCSADYSFVDGPYGEQTFENQYVAGNSISLPSGLLIGEKIKNTVHKDVAVCYKNHAGDQRKYYDESWKEFVKVEKDSQTYKGMEEEFLSMLKTKLLHFYAFEDNGNPKLDYDDDSFEDFLDQQSLELVQQNGYIGCPDDFDKYDDESFSCLTFNSALVLKYLGGNEPYGWGVVGNSVNVQILKDAVPYIGKAQLCWYDVSGDNSCSSCAYGDNIPTSCKSYGDMSTCNNDPCMLNCRWVGTSSSGSCNVKL